MNIVINGDFYDHKITGVQRYAMEVIRELDERDHIGEDVHIELLVPEDSKNVPILKNISVVKYGRNKKILWQQLCLWKYCAENNAVCVCLCTLVPFFYYKHSINVVHDAGTLVHPEFYSPKYLFLNKVLLWSRIQYLKQIVTVSEFSRDEISRYCGISKEKIIIAKCAADHMFRVKADDSIFEEQEGIKKGEYCFSLSSIAPNKNFKWVMEVAKRNRQETFLIAGVNLAVFSEEKQGEVPDNVRFLGYVSDEAMAALIQNCKLFLFPTLYEGFGMTPLEALMLGCKVVVSDIPCMHEVYGDCALYIDPYQYDYRIHDLVEQSKDVGTGVTGKYRWKYTAEVFCDIFRRLE